MYLVLFKLIFFIYSVTIKLGVPGVILGVNIDTTGHAQCAPITVAIDGHLKSSPGNVNIFMMISNQSFLLDFLT